MIDLCLYLLVISGIAYLVISFLMLFFGLNEKIVKTFSIFFLTLCGILCSLIFALMFYTPKYTAKDISYKHTSEAETYSVEVRGIRKEKNKEDIYKLSIGGFLRKELSIPKSQYEELVGTGNNAITSNEYTLTLRVPQKIKSQYIWIRIYRYAFLGESDFIEEEIAEISNIFLEALNDQNNEKILQKINSSICFNTKTLDFRELLFFQDVPSDVYARNGFKQLSNLL